MIAPTSSRGTTTGQTEDGRNDDDDKTDDDDTTDDEGRTEDDVVLLRLKTKLKKLPCFGKSEPGKIFIRGGCDDRVGQTWRRL